MMKRAKLHGCLILAQLMFAGFEILSRVALTNGMHPLSFTFYRNCVASLALGAAAAWKESKHNRPELRTLLYFFGLGFLGVTVNQVCYLTGLKYTSAIFASAMRNSTPVFTFVMAALWRIEKVCLKRRDGQLKTFGSLLGLCGSLILSIYRGPVVIKSNISISSTSAGTTAHVQADAISTLNLYGHSISLASWEIGSFFLALSCIAFGVFLILQTPVLVKYPAPISFAAMTCASSVLQAPLVEAACELGKWQSWKLTSISQGLTILYAGLVGSALVSSIQSWGVLMQGPVIVAAYQPLETIFTALFSLVFLREDLHLGTIIGGIIVVAGLYSLICGRQHEQREKVEPGQALQTITSLDNRPHSLSQYPFRRFSCDLETRRKDDRDYEKSAQRRHSLTVFASSDSPYAQGPLRRISSTFRSLFRESDRDGGDTDNQHLLVVEEVQP